MKNRILLYWRKFKYFITKKRRFPLIIHIDLNYPWSKDKWELRKQISYLRHENNLLRKEIKKLGIIVQLRDMQISLDKKGDY